MKSRFARTLLLVGALLGAFVLISVIGTRGLTRTGSTTPPSATPARATIKRATPRGPVRAAQPALTNVFNFRAGSNFNLNALLAPLTAAKTGALDTSAGGDVNGNNFINPGDRITYTLTVTNGGTTANNVTVNDTFDTNTAFVAGSLIGSPIAVNDSYQTIGNVDIDVPAAQGLLANDLNPLMTGTLIIISAPTMSAGGGTVSINTTTGAFTYNPPVNFRMASDSFTYTLSNGSGLNDTATVTINFSGMIWFVNAGAAGGGDGRRLTPFNCFVGAGCFSGTTNDIAGDNIFLYTGSYTGGQTLLNNQRLIGQGASASILTITGLSAPSGSTLLPATGGTNPTITTTLAATNAVTVGTGNTIRGITFGNTTGADIIGANFGTLTIGPATGASDVTLNGNGQALNLVNGTLAANIAAISSTNSAAAGVDITQTSGSLVSGSTTISNPTTTGISIGTSSATFNFANTSITGSGSTSVSLAGNSGAITFADLDITPDSGFAALLASTSTGTLTTTSGTISTTNSLAIQIVGTSAASRTPINLVFDSVSVNGGANGIVLTNTQTTGSPGGLTINGTGTTDGSGGTIQNITNRGASFINANDITLKNMTFTNVGTVNGADPTNPTGTCGGLQSGTNTGCNAGIHADGVTDLTLTNVDLSTGAQQGINANNLTNFTFTNSNVTGFGNQVNEDGVRINNLLGTSTWTNVHLFLNNEFQAYIQNESGTGSLSITNSEFNHNCTNCTSSVDGLQYSGQGTANMTLSVTNSSFHDLASGAWQSDTQGSATLDLTFSDNTLQNFGSAAIIVAKGGSGTVSFDILNNTIKNTGQNPSGVGHGIVINKASPSPAGSLLQGTISGNTIGDYVDAVTADPDTDDKGSGIRIIAIDEGTLTATVSNNDIRDFRERGIYTQMSEDNSGNNAMNLSITNNTVNNREVVAEHGILVIGGSLSGDNGTLCANLTGNNSFSAGGDGIRIRATQSTVVRLPGYVGPSTGLPITQAQTFVAGNNPATTDSISVATLGSGTIVGGAACATPALMAPIDNNSSPTRSQEKDTAHLLEKLLGVQPRWSGYLNPTGAGRSANRAIRPATRPTLSAFATPLSYFNPLNLFERPAAAATLAEKAAPVNLPVAQPVAAHTVSNSAPVATATKLSPAAAFACATPNGCNLGTLPPGEIITLQFKATVNSSPSNFYSVTNTASFTADGGATTSNTTTATNTVVQPPQITKAFASDFVSKNGTVNLAFTITNPNPSTAFTQVAFNDVLPVGLNVADNSTSQCGGTLTTTAATRTIALSGANVASNGGTCTFTVAVTAGTTEGLLTNTSGTVSSLQGGTGGTASDTITVIDPPTLSKSFTPNVIQLNGTSTLQFTLNNPNTTLALNTLTFTDSLPTGVTTPDTAATTVCGDGSYSITSNVLSFTKPSLAAGQNCVFSITVTGTTTGAKTNTTSTITTANSNPGTAATAMLDVLGPPTIAKAFAPTAIQSGGSSTVTLTLTNANSIPLTNASFSDTLTNMSAVGGAVGGTCAGTTPSMLSAGATSLSFSGITIPGSGSCTVTFAVTSSTVGMNPNTTSGVTTMETPAVGNPSNTANLTVFGAPAISKAFSPTTIAPGGSSTVTLTLMNPNASNLTNASFSDMLVNMSAVGGAVSGTCVGTTPNTLAAGATTLSFIGITIPASNSCTVTFAVTSSTQGSNPNTTSGVTTTQTPVAGPVSNTANLTVLNPPTIAKAFSPTTIQSGGTSTVTLTLSNSNGSALTNGSFTDTLVNMSAVGGAVGGTCVGTTPNTLAAGATALSFSGITIPDSGSCTVTFDVTSSSPGTRPNSTSGVTTAQTPVAGAASNTVNLTVLAAPTIAKAFGAASIQSGGSTSVTLTLSNSNTMTLTGGSFTDTLVNMSAVGGAVTGTCTGTMPNTLVAGATNLSFSGINIPSGSCTVIFSITSSTPGAQSNQTSGVTTTQTPTAGAASNTANLTVFAAPTIAKAFAPNTIAPGGTSTVTLTLSNSNGSALTNGSFTDTLVNMSAVGGAVGGTCVGTTPNTLAAGATALSFSGITIPDSGSCTVTFAVTSSTAGVQPNMTSGVTTTQTPVAGAASNTANLSVFAFPTISKAFAPATIQSGATSTVTLTLDNTNATTFTNASFTDTLANMSAVGGAVTGTCAGTTPNTLAAGATALSFSGITIPSSGTCTVIFDVTSTTPGVQPNTTSGVTTTQTPTAGPVSNTANLTVLAGPTIAKAFAPTAIQAGGMSTVTLTLSNSTATPLTNGSFSDTLVNMSAVGGAVGGTCTGTTPNTLAAGATSLSFSGINIPASSFCTVTFAVTSSTPGTQPNMTSGVTTTQTPTAGAASNIANLTVFAAPTIAKAFSPTTIAPGGNSTVTLTLTNPNAGALSNGSFTDTLVNMSAVGGAVGGTCTGTTPNTLAAGATSLSFSGITIPASGFCTVTFAVTSSTPGTQPNMTSGVTTTQTPSAGAPSNTANLAVFNLPTISKAFSPTSIQSGGTSTVTLTLSNSNATNLTNASFTDTLTNMSAAGGAVTGTCAGTTPNTLAAGATNLSFSGITIPASGSCTVIFNVTSSSPGTRPNTTSGVTTTQTTTAGSASNTANLSVFGPPTISKSFTSSSIVVGQTSTLNIVVGNPAANPGNLTGVSFTDTLPAGITAPNSSTSLCGGTVTVSGNIVSLSGGNIAANTTCTIPITVTGTQASASAYTNTISSVTSANGGTNSTPATANITVNKANTTTVITGDTPDPSSCGQAVTVTYTVTPVAPGAGTPTGNVTVSDGVNSCVGTVAAGQCLLTLTTFGNRTLTASYVGDGNFNGGTSAGVPHQVTDTSAPVITCPANQVGVTNISAPNSPVAVSYPAPTVTDSCSSASVTCVPPSGSNFALGTTTVNCTATDAASNTAACSFTVTVREPRAAVKDLIKQVQALVPPLTQAGLLIGPLELAANRIERGQLVQACAEMQTFVNRVNSFVTNGQLTIAQGQALRSYANKIRNALNCTGGPFPAFRAETVGLYLAEQGEFKLKNRLLSGPAEWSEPGGAPTDQPVAGDWDGDGVDTLGVYRDGIFYLRNNGGWAAAPNKADGRLNKGAETVIAFGQAGDVPVVGDWNGDGIDTIGVFRNGQFLLRNSNTAGEPDVIINLGQAGDIPLAGDWDGDGTVTVGVYQVASGVFQLRNGWADGAEEVLVLWGGADYLPLVGDWDGDGITTVGLYSRTGEFLLRNSNTAGPAEISFTLGLADGIPLAGDWDGLP